MPDPTQFFGLPSPGREQADALVLPLPVEKTVSYGTGAGSGPRRSLPRAFRSRPSTRRRWSISPSRRGLHVLPPLSAEGDIEDVPRANPRHRPPAARQVPLGPRRRAQRDLRRGRGIGRRSGGSDRGADRRPRRPGRQARRPALVARHGDAAALGAGLPADADRHPQHDAQTSTKSPPAARASPRISCTALGTVPILRGMDVPMLPANG